MYYVVLYKAPVGQINGWKFPAPLLTLLSGLSQKASKKSPIFRVTRRPLTTYYSPLTLVPSEVEGNHQSLRAFHLLKPLRRLASIFRPPLVRIRARKPLFLALLILLLR
jgi:hypothetical protein